MSQITNPLPPSADVLLLKSNVGGGGAMKETIILFDAVPGTKMFIVPANVYKIRRAVVGAGGLGDGSASGHGGGYSEDELDVTPFQEIPYVVGAAGSAPLNSPFAGATGGTSSMGGQIFATGGGFGTGNPGVGSGGAVNSKGGRGGPVTGSGSSIGVGGGGASGHRFGDGGNGGPSASSTSGGGGGWGQNGSLFSSGGGFIDGFGLGLTPGNPAPSAYSSAIAIAHLISSYGSGGAGSGQNGPYGGNGGIGGGGGGHGQYPGVAGYGGGGPTFATIAFSYTTAGNGVVIVEVIG